MNEALLLSAKILLAITLRIFKFFSLVIINIATIIKI